MFDIMKLEALPEIHIVYGYAGENRLMLDAVVGKGAAGMVNAGTGDGSMSDAMKTAYREARQKRHHRCQVFENGKRICSP